MSSSIDNKYIILIGNPGVGKSTILNGLIKEVRFKNGFNPGKGLTTVLQMHKHKDNIHYGDTPGLSDVKMREQAAKEITEALQKNGEYKLIFVVTEEAGRIRPDDVTTINLVLSSVKTKIEYGIIINKVSKVFVKLVSTDDNKLSKEDLMKKEEGRKNLFAGLNSGIHKTDHIYYFQRDPELDDLDDTLPVLPQTVVDFIHIAVPFTLVLKQDVDKIELDKFESLKSAFEKQIDEMKKDSLKRDEMFQKTIQDLEKKRDEIQNQYQAQMERFQDEQKKLYEKMDRERKEHHRKLEEEQIKYDQKMEKANEENRSLIREQNEKFQQEMQMREVARKESEENMKKELEYLRNRPPPQPQVIHRGGRGMCQIF